jgi:hypothetical protein
VATTTAVVFQVEVAAQVALEAQKMTVIVALIARTVGVAAVLKPNVAVVFAAAVVISAKMEVVLWLLVVMVAAAAAASAEDV